MIAALRAARAFITAIIATLLAVGFVPREIAARLVPLQKFLAKEIERRTRQ